MSETQNYGDILKSIGYKLIDCGDHWRTKAIYRNGSGSTSVKIYKNSGVWSDFGIENGCKPFQALVEATVKDKKRSLNIVKNISSVDTYQPKDRIEMEKVYPNECLDDLFPNYSFYKKRGISENTQRKFKVGLANIGKMYRRMTFPIYNEHSQIIGFSGRKIDDNNDFPKWKQIGKKSKWVYPVYVPESESDEEITKKREAILVESIGDALALYENGIKNVIVIFGVSTSWQVINYLSSKELDRIIISTNNDTDSKDNNGLIGAIKCYLKLSKIFDLERLIIKFPPKGMNDFGKAHEEDYNMINWVNREIDQSKQKEFIYDFVTKNKKLFSEDHRKIVKRFNG